MACHDGPASRAGDKTRACWSLKSVQWEMNRPCALQEVVSPLRYVGDGPLAAAMRPGSAVEGGYPTGTTPAAARVPPQPSFPSHSAADSEQWDEVREHLNHFFRV